MCCFAPVANSFALYCKELSSVVYHTPVVRVGQNQAAAYSYVDSIPLHTDGHRFSVNPRIQISESAFPSVDTISQIKNRTVQLCRLIGAASYLPRLRFYCQFNCSLDLC